MANEQKLYLSQLGDSLRFCYGDVSDVAASYIYDRIKEVEDVCRLEPVSLIVNEDEIDDSVSEMLKHISEHLEIGKDGEIELAIDASDSYSINYKTLPVIVDVTKEQIAEGNECWGCKTSYLAQQTCPVCGNEGIDDNYPPIILKTVLKRDAYHPQDFGVHWLERDIEEIRRTCPDYDPTADFVLWLTVDLYERFENENVYGTINIFKKDGSTIPVDTIIRKPYPNKNYHQISRRVKVDKAWKRNFGIPLVFKSLDDINEIDRFCIKWEIHTKVDHELLVETMIVNHPFSLRDYCTDDRKRIASVKLRDYFVDSLSSLNSYRRTRDYVKGFARSCVFEDAFTVDELQSQDDIYSNIHDSINGAIYEGEITSSEKLMSIKPNLDAIKKSIADMDLSDNFVWRITFGMRYIRENLKFHQ